jgi:hypothetical protein
MKYLIIFFTILSFGSIIFGYFFESDYEQKFIGFGVMGIFFIVFPLFSYYRWKDKDIKDYMITKENIDKMRDQNR